MCIRDSEGVVGLTILFVEWQILEFGRYRLAAGSAIGNLQRVGTHDFKTQGFLVFADAIERSGIGMGDGFRGQQDVFQQAIDIAPVSYTHLDVYKRQQQILENSIFLLRCHVINIYFL